MGTQDYRDILRKTLKSKCERNPRFTQGAFAKQLGLSSSRLSEILAGKQGLSVKWAIRIAEKLKFSELDKQFFCQLVQAEHSRSPVQRDRSKAELKKRSLKSPIALPEETFKVIAEWQHLAILELYTQDSSLNVVQCAKRLRITKAVAQTSLDRLVRIGQMTVLPNGGYKVLHDITMTTQDIPSATLRTFHQSMIQKASKSLEVSSPETREISSVILSANSKNISQLKLQLRELRDRFAVEVDNDSSKDSVYCLNINFFRLDD